jgi:hypothetical protein
VRTVNEADHRAVGMVPLGVVVHARDDGVAALKSQSRGPHILGGRHEIKGGNVQVLDHHSTQPQS